MISSNLPNGRVEIVLQRAYTLGGDATIPLTVVATRGSVAGPVAAKVLASGIGEGGPAEALVRTLATSAVTAMAGQSRTTSVSWDGHDEKGVLVPADAYSLVLEFDVEDRGSMQRATATATLQMSAP